MRTKHNYELKPLLEERMKSLLSEKDFEKYLEILKQPVLKSIRCNTLKISPKQLKEKLENKGWKINQPWKNYPEVMIVEGKLPSQKISQINEKQLKDNNSGVEKRGSDALEGEANSNNQNLIELSPGELGRSFEHLLGYYYIQELASMLPIIALNPKSEEFFLDLCASPGSKTTQAAALMQNTGTIIANEVVLGRVRILGSNLERCGITNTIITKDEGTAICNRLKKNNYKFDKILVDAPCSGEGTLRGSPKTYLMWNINTVRKLSKTQKRLFQAAFELLKINGEMIYSTCTHSPEENEEIVDWALKGFKDEIKIETISLPITPRQGINKWGEKEYLEDVKYSCRVYPQDNNTEGFFLAKFKKIK